MLVVVDVGVSTIQVGHLTLFRNPQLPPSRRAFTALLVFVCAGFYVGAWYEGSIYLSVGTRFCGITLGLVFVERLVSVV